MVTCGACLRSLRFPESVVVRGDMFKCKRCGKKFKKMESLGAHTRSAHWLLLLLEKGYTPSQLKEQGYHPAAVNKAAKGFRR